MNTQTLSIHGSDPTSPTRWWSRAAFCRQSVRAILIALVGTLLIEGSAEARTIQKRTKFQSLSASPLRMKNGSPVTLKAQLTYRDKQRNWVYLGYTSVPVIFIVDGQRVESVNTNTRDGFVTLTTTAHRDHVSKRGSRVNWSVRFERVGELNGCRAGGSFTILP